MDYLSGIQAQQVSGFFKRFFLLSRAYQVSLHGAYLQHLIPQWAWNPGLPCSSLKIQSLPLLNFIWLVIAQPSNLLRSLCRASLPLRESTAPLNLLSSANLLIYSWVLCPSSLWRPWGAQERGWIPIEPHWWQLTSLMSSHSLKPFMYNPWTCGSPITRCVYPAVVCWTFCSKGHCDRRQGKLYWYEKKVA